MPKDRDGVHTRPDRSGFFITYTDANGRRRKKKVHAKNLTEARAMRSALIGKVQRQKILGVTEAADDTFAKLTEKYLQYQRPRVSEDSYKRIEGIIECHLKPAFEGKIGNITRSKISDFVTDRLNEASPGTVQKEFNVIKHVLRMAHEEWNLIPENPAKTLTMKSLRIKLPPGRVRYLHPDELLTLLEHCPEWLRPIVVLAVATGLRRGSILQLRWPQYDERRRMLMIQHTKNNDRVVVHLNEIGLMGLLMATAHFGRGDLGRIFPDVTEDMVSMAFRRACKTAKIQDFKFHDLRHTHASWLRMNGADIHTVSQMLGHKDLRMTLRYSHLSSDFMANAANSLNGTFSSLLALNPAPDTAADGVCPPIVPGTLIVDDESG